MANIIDDEDDRLIDAEDSSTDDDDDQQEDGEQEEQTLSLPPVVGSGKRKIKKSEMKRNKLIPIEPGLIRLSGLPYGFFERELYSYFSQFGVVTRLKLIRSKKTGGSRGYAYIEFEDEDVACIAAETMNGYLMFRSLIKSRLMDRKKIDTEKLFRNWKRLFTVKTPKKKRALYNRLKSNEQTEKSNQRRAKKLLKQQDKLAAAGIKYDLTDFIPLKALKKNKVQKSPTSENKNEKTPGKTTEKKSAKK
jgi:RNA recognition motif-containing protein